MHKQSRKSPDPVLNQLNTAAEVLATLRWAVDRTLVDEDLDAFIAIARSMMPAARAALEAIKPSSVSIHLSNAVNALAYVESAVDLALVAPDFDQLIGIADPSIGRAECAIADAQALLREKVRPVSRSTRKSLRGHTVAETSLAAH
jgi:hypothetical protein